MLVIVCLYGCNCSTDGGCWRCAVVLWSLAVVCHKLALAVVAANVRACTRPRPRCAWTDSVCVCTHEQVCVYTRARESVYDLERDYGRVVFEGMDCVCMCMCTCMSMRTYACMYVYACISMYVCMHTVHMYVCMYVYVYVCVHKCSCVFVPAYVHPCAGFGDHTSVCMRAYLIYND